MKIKNHLPIYVLFLSFLNIAQGQDVDLFDNSGYQWTLSTLGDNEQTLSIAGGDAADAPLLLRGDDGSMEKVVPESTSKAFVIKNDVQSSTNVFEIYTSGQIINREGIQVLARDNERPLEIYSEEKGENVMQVMKSGKIFSTEIEVKLLGFPDYVFQDSYELMPIHELSAYINKYRHLPNIPTAEDVEENGIGLGELQLKQLEKVEELTLYLLEINERLEKLETENKTLKKQLEELKANKN